MKMGLFKRVGYRRLARKVKRNLRIYEKTGDERFFQTAKYYQGILLSKKMSSLGKLFLTRVK